MGKEFEVNTLEEMCDLMCDNNIPGQFECKNWIFTFGCGQQHAGHYVKIFGTFESARAEMCERYGDKWAFQYTEEQFNGNETELEVME